jgi:uncharacterized membrane protein YgaE (UPF0421/DUF939 family)
MIFGREPAAIAAVIAIAINLAITFGLKLTVEQVALINTLVVGLLGLLVRNVSTPTASPRLEIGTVVTAPKGGEPGIVTSTVR